MTVHLAGNPAEIARCYPVVNQLRPNLTREDFVGQVLRQIRRHGYRLAYLEQETGVVSCLGCRPTEHLAWGKILYIDDLVTLPEYRGSGFGTRLIGWAKDFAKAADCTQIHLDSGLSRVEAHRFYQAHGFEVRSLHFYVQVVR